MVRQEIATLRASTPAPFIHKDSNRLQVTTRPSPRFQADLNNSNHVGGHSALSLITEALLQTEKDHERWANETAAQNSITYNKLFADLGVSAEIARRIQYQLKKLHLESAQAGTAYQELLLSRNRFDQDLRSLLPPEAYERYVEYEKDKPAFRELSQINSFAESEKTIPIHPERQKTLVDLIKKTKAYSETHYDSPYSPGQLPILGKDAIVNHHQEKIERLTTALSYISAQSEVLGFTHGERTLIDNYFQKTIGAMKTERDYWNRPDEDIKAEADRNREEWAKKVREELGLGRN